jgi:hypothetical protein
MNQNAVKNITLDSVLAQVNDLASLERYGQLLAQESQEHLQQGRLVAATKTVSTFSRLLGRKLQLIPAKFAYTDGFNIGAPVDHPYFYEFVEHEISHNLFKSNFEAKKNFCEQYVLQVSKALAAFGTVMSPDDRNYLTNMVGTILNIIEDHRVNSLWAMLYPGSYKRLEEHSRSIVEKKKATAHDDIIGYFLCVAYNAKIPPGVFDRFEPAMVASLKKVERKGPGSTFVIGKWLMTQIVSEMIRITKKLPPPPKAGKSTMKTDLDDMGDAFGGDAGNDDSDGGADDADGSNGDGDAGDDGGAPGLDGAPPAKSKQKAGDDAKGGGKGTQPDDSAQFSTQPQPSADKGDGQGGAQGGGADWEPPKVDATPEERIDAFKKLLEAARTMGQAAKSPMQAALDRVNNDKPSASKDHSLSASARKLVADAYATDVSNKDALDAFLDKSEGDMVKVMDTIQEALEQVAEPTEREWNTRNVGSRVVFRDITEASYKVPPLKPDDQRTVARMKDTFHRVKNRNAKALTDDGVEIDVQALIAQRVSGQVGPVFRTDVSGRGFKVLILTDRSSSMQGLPSDAVERAARILRGALKIQNVEMHSWGFHGSGDSVHLSRIAPNLDVADSSEMPAIGTTPMATAIRVALNWLSTGYEKKHLILLTDGDPNHSDVLDGKTSYGAVQRELMRAAKLKVETTTLVIGDGIKDAACLQMFGNRRRWKRVKQGVKFESLTKTLVDLVSTSFSNHLKGG